MNSTSLNQRILAWIFLALCLATVANYYLGWKLLGGRFDKDAMVISFLIAGVHVLLHAPTKREVFEDRNRRFQRSPSETLKAMNPEAAQANERILAQVESWGGSYAWDAEIFAVTLLDVAVTDAQAAILRGLTEVEQIALNASRLTFPTIQAIAGIPGLESLVISNIELTSEQRDLLRSAGPEVEMIEHEP